MSERVERLVKATIDNKITNGVHHFSIWMYDSEEDMYRDISETICEMKKIGYSDVGTIIANAEEKHILVYFNNETKGL